jgi:hypothetical protein
MAEWRNGGMAEWWNGMRNRGVGENEERSRRT